MIISYVSEVILNLQIQLLLSLLSQQILYMHLGRNKELHVVFSNENIFENCLRNKISLGVQVFFFF